jgi:hypothetical protein
MPSPFMEDRCDDQRILLPAARAWRLRYVRGQRVHGDNQVPGMAAPLGCHGPCRPRRGPRRRPAPSRAQSCQCGLDRDEHPNRSGSHDRRCGPAEHDDLSNGGEGLPLGCDTTGIVVGDTGYKAGPESGKKLRRTCCAGKALGTEVSLYVSCMVRSPTRCGRHTPSTCRL